MANPFDPPLTAQDIDAVFQGRFPVVDILPPGGQGALFIVSYPPDQAVLKIYKNAHTLRAEREANTLLQMDCEYIVRLLDWGKNEIRGEECVFTVTEYIDGISLYDELQNRQLSEAEAYNLGRCLTEAISSLWLSDRIIHRDIKPENIILRPNHDAILIDLGIARHRNLTRLTSWGVTWGTEGYMSPEQASGRRGLTYRSDLFSMGIVLYEAASMIHPFNRRQDLIGRIIPQALNSVCQISQDFSDLVQELMEVDPLNRPRIISHTIARLQRGI